ncbi:RWD domain-containing protein [Sclerotinia borealis F-4128]|uniref:RWD domain-containing protein n=1 Tax=Sclerotinia borealis (strain F-4128) TaxID=1432307 RepID=W9CER4_SCLBF|nr:RWD domain-containing protein [Sclerotinia borealis F-4128]
MSEDLLNEIEAINSIYGPNTLVSAHETPNQTYILALPKHDTWLRIHFPNEYPHVPPIILGTHRVGEDARRGDAALLAGRVRDIVGRVWTGGGVCMFDVCEEVEGWMNGDRASEGEGDVQETRGNNTEVPRNKSPIPAHTSQENILIDSEPPAPTWTLSDPTTELKSTFLARCARVSSPSLAKQYIQHLIAHDKKVRSATHNITAWRMKGAEGKGIVYQDCDDDGEAGAGGKVLRLLQQMDVWGVVMVVTRWYGGVKLGSRRFAVINGVARGALVKGGWVDVAGSVKGGGEGEEVIGLDWIGRWRWECVLGCGV